MLRVDQVYIIRHKVKTEGLSIRHVAKSMGLSRNTVRKYLSMSEPVRQERTPRKRPSFDKVKPRMDALIEEWKSRTTQKQKVTATRLHRALRDEGYDVGVTLVRDYLREQRRRKTEVYVPLIHHPGDAKLSKYRAKLIFLRSSWMSTVSGVKHGCLSYA